MNLPEADLVFEYIVCPCFTHRRGRHGNGGNLSGGFEVTDAGGDGLDQRIQGVLHVRLVLRRKIWIGENTDQKCSRTFIFNLIAHLYGILYVWVHVYI